MRGPLLPLPFLARRASPQWLGSKLHCQLSEYNGAQVNLEAAACAANRLILLGLLWL